MRASITPPPYGQASQPRHMGMRLSPAVWASITPAVWAYIPAPPTGKHHTPPYGHTSRPAVWVSITPRRRAYITPRRMGIHHAPPYGHASQPRRMGKRLSPAIWACITPCHMGKHHAPPCGDASCLAVWAYITPRRTGMHLSPAVWASITPRRMGKHHAPPYGQASRPAVWAYITPCRTGIHLSPAVRAYAASWAACTSERRCCGAGSSTCAHRHGIALCRHTSEIHLAPISPKNIPLSIIGKGDACFYSICSGAVIISGSGGKMFSSKTQM